MRLLFRQRFFSWFDSYDIYSETGETLYTVKGQLSWGHCLKIFDAAGREVGTVRERVFRFLPCFELYCGTQYSGCVRRLLTFFRPQYTVECNGWQVQGDLFGWEYTVITGDGRPVATVSKQLFQWTDTYGIEVVRPEDALCVLMLVLAIDAEKCSRNNA